MCSSRSLPTKSQQNRGMHSTASLAMLLLLGGVAVGSLAWMGLPLSSHDHHRVNHPWNIGKKTRARHRHNHRDHDRSRTPDRYICKIQGSYRIQNDSLSPDHTPTIETAAVTSTTTAGVVPVPTRMATKEERAQAAELLNAAYNRIHTTDFEMRSTVLTEIEILPTRTPPSETNAKSTVWDGVAEFFLQYHEQENQHSHLMKQLAATILGIPPQTMIPRNEDQGSFHDQTPRLRGQGNQGAASAPSTRLSVFGSLATASSPPIPYQVARFHGKTSVVERPRSGQDLPGSQSFSASRPEAYNDLDQGGIPSRGNKTSKPTASPITIQETEWHRRWEKDWCRSLVEQGAAASTAQGDTDLFFRSAHDCTIDLYDCVPMREL